MITEGMTPIEFINEINSILIDLSPNYTGVNKDMSGVELEAVLNTEFSKTYSLVGMRGISYINTINGNLEFNIEKPTGFGVTWVDDYVQIDFTSEDELAQHQIYESLNGGDYELVHTIDAGVRAYNYYTWQNANLNFKVRAKNVDDYSKFTDVINLKSPLVFKTDQTTLTTITIEAIKVDTDKTVYMDFGDGDGIDIIGRVTDIVKNYLIEGIYFITLSGDIDYLVDIEFHNNTTCFGDLTKWILPSELSVLHLYSNNFSGDVTGWVFPNKLNIFHIGFQPGMTGDITGKTLPSTFRDWHVEFTNLSGDPSSLFLPAGTYHNKNIGCHFTTGARGVFSHLYDYFYYNNNFSDSEIDFILDYIDNSFTGGVVPVRDCEYDFTGANMGTPSAAGLASIASIEGKYISAGFTATITVNS
jgi:hypothetical protein